MELEQFVVLGAVIAGVTELITRLRAKDFWVALTIVCAAAVGALFGAIGYYANMDVAEGIAYGFGASGFITILGSFGNRSKPAPSTDTLTVTE